MTVSVGVFVIGAGNIGKHLINQLSLTNGDKQQKCHVLGYSTSAKFFLNSPASTSTSKYEEVIGGDGESTIDMICTRVLPKFEKSNTGDGSSAGESRLLFVDCTGSQTVPIKLYRKIVSQGHKLVLCNKIGLCQELELFDLLYEKYQRQVRFEATVMAGIPVIHTLHALLDYSGDTVTEMEAVLSGTLSFLFNTFCSQKDRLFSEIVQEAVERGYAEPDFWIDLGGLDVARKMLIMARMMGARIDLKDCHVDPVLPKPVDWDNDSNLPISVALAPVNEKMEILRSQKSAGIPRYIGKITAKGINFNCSVSTQILSPDHPFCGLKGTECAILVKTKYIPMGILLQGPGAGRESTVFGIMSDIGSLIERQG